MSESIGHYRVLSRLGAGGMGDVFLAEDERLRRRVAIKRLKSGAPADPDACKRLLIEARAAARLDHPNICGIYEVGEDAVGPFIVMPVVEGETLAARLARGPLAIAEAVDIGAQIADALAAAHGQGILHRDIKPANVIVGARGQVRVMDFGLAKFTGAEGHPDAAGPTVTDLTEMGTTLGTAAYMSPEQARGELVDARSDLFSLGVVLFEMIAGRRPFDGRSLAEILTATQALEPPPLARFRPETPDALQRIGSKALRKAPQERYQSANDLLVDLRAVQRELQSGATAGQPVAAAAVPSRRRPAPLTIAAAGLTLLAVVVVVAGLMAPRFLGRAALGGSSAAIDSLAVLPLANNTGSADNDYLADGITESLIRNLAQLPALKVISRNSVFKFKGRSADAQTIAGQLGVRAVMTGAIKQMDDALAIDIEVSSVDDARVIFSRQYVEQASRVLLMEADIAQDLVKSLRLSMTGEDARQMARQPTISSAAYQRFLRGKFFQSQMTPEALHKAIDEYQLAVEEDPMFAMAYAAMAGAYVTLGTYFEAPKDAMTRARAYAGQALAIDSSLTDARISMGMVSLLYDWDWAAAARQLTTSDGLDTRASEAFSCSAHILQSTGQVGESEREIRRALASDPLSTELTTELGCNAYYRRNYDQAIRGYQDALKLDPRNVVAYYGLGRAFGQKQMYREALDELKKAEAINGDAPPLIVSEMGYVYARTGRAAEARAIIGRLTAPAQPAFVDPYLVATVYAGLGDQTHALDWLDKAYEIRSGFMTGLAEEPKWDELRANPRFQDLVKRVGFV